jgi:hypothetical protein
MIKQCPECEHIFDTEDAETYTDDTGRSLGGYYIICPACGTENCLEDYPDPKEE